MVTERQFTIDREYRHARRVPFLNFKCSACGGICGRYGSACKHCGADLR